MEPVNIVLIGIMIVFLYFSLRIYLRNKFWPILIFTYSAIDAITLRLLLDFHYISLYTFGYDFLVIAYYVSILLGVYMLWKAVDKANGKRRTVRR